MRRSLNDDMARFHNLAKRSQLRTLGYSARDIGTALEDHRLWPIRRQWLMHQGADAASVRAVALGGRLAAASALSSYGIWVTRSTGLWIQVPESASHVSQLRPGEHRLWMREHFTNRSDQQWRMSVQDSLLQYAKLGSEEDVTAAFDSALNTGLLSRSALDDVFSVMPRRLRRLLSRIDGKAASGLETLLRLAAEAEGWHVEIQVEIAGVGRVDVLIDGWLVIELDGARWHDNHQSQEEDRRRDAELVRRGYRWHRFRSSQVLTQMPLCIDVIRTILASGRPPVSPQVCGRF
ncbi:MAG TPA: DUF559 domain-containing protein [Glaciibacter sp.]|nr:DUF559 domain-containing protein [Glaciibacter sp.]